MSNVTELRLVDTNIPSREVLHEALAAGVENVIILGYDKDGEFYFAASNPDGMKALWLLELAKHKLIETCIQLEKGEIPLV